MILVEWLCHLNTASYLFSILIYRVSIIQHSLIQSVLLNLLKLLLRKLFKQFRQICRNSPLLCVYSSLFAERLIFLHSQKFTTILFFKTFLVAFRTTLLAGRPIYFTLLLKAIKNLLFLLGLCGYFYIHIYHFFLYSNELVFSNA